MRALMLAAIIAATPVVPAMAQQACGPRAEIVAVLAEKYGETQQGTGLQSASAMIEIWASASTGSWTILVTQITGISCVVAAGQSWTVTPQAQGTRL